MIRIRKDLVNGVMLFVPLEQKFAVNDVNGDIVITRNNFGDCAINPPFPFANATRVSLTLRRINTILARAIPMNVDGISNLQRRAVSSYDDWKVSP